MFKVTYLHHGNKLSTVTHPERDVCLTLAWSLQGQGFKVRFWDKSGRLVF